MATIDVFDMNKNKVGSMELDDSVFNAEVKQHLIHEAIRVQLTNRRAGTVAVKNRSQVAGSGRKPFKQKGTGQARQGCRRAPQYPGGGVAFGPQPKDYHLSMNKKAYKAAMRSMLTYLMRENKLTVVRAWELDGVSTKSFVDVLNNFSLKKTLVVIDDQNRNLELSARNVKDVKLLKADGLNVYDMMNFKNVLFTEAAVRKVEGAFQS